MIFKSYNDVVIDNFFLEKPLIAELISYFDSRYVPNAYKKRAAKLINNRMENRFANNIIELNMRILHKKY